MLVYIFLPPLLKGETKRVSFVRIFMKKIYTTNSKGETQELAKEVLRNLDGRNVILLQGELGAGKTTFAQGVLEYLGAKGPFTSPTFVIMKKYEASKQTARQLDSLAMKNIFHIDCYRVGAKDIQDLGWEEIVANKNNLVLVEWPERMKKIWPKEYVKLDFESKREEKRCIYYNIY